MMAKPMFQLLQALPEELLQDILERVDKRNLSSLNLASRWAYAAASPLIWRDVDLIDCRRPHANGEVDEHDDTPLLRKLVILATNPWLASQVHVVTHRCHLPPPSIFEELPDNSFSGQTLSPDPRTTKLVQLAVRHMSAVHTLRVIFGHPNLTDALLRSFFGKDRDRTTPIRRLWLENCRISAGCCLSIDQHLYGLPLVLDFTGLESIRLRRLPIHPDYIQDHMDETDVDQYVYSRSGLGFTLQDGAGGRYTTSCNSRCDETFEPESSTLRFDVDRLFDRAFYYDDSMYGRLTREIALPVEVYKHYIPPRDRWLVAWRGPWLDPTVLDPIGMNVDGAFHPVVKVQRERLPSADVALGIMHSASATLTSLCLDWVLTRHGPKRVVTSSATDSRTLALFVGLFSLRFPHLRALQLRNTIVPQTVMPRGLYLLDHAQVRIMDETGSEGARGPHEELLKRADLVCLTFMEAHPKLQCLAWPMERFLSHQPIRSDIADRVLDVIDNLGRTLLDLRVDTRYSGVGELQTEDTICSDKNARDSRRRFISKFAAKMTKVESIKIEGGVPRDERRETVRALFPSPLKKIVMIGVCSPIGNTWGADGQELPEHVGSDHFETLEHEDKDAVFSLGSRRPEALSKDFRFEVESGWPPGPPMIHTLASLHAGTVTELKFCGYKGAPVLFTPTPITTPLLSGLKYFDRIESFTMSMWLSTTFEGSLRDADVIMYWLDSRSPASTSLVRITDEAPMGWEKELRTKYAPGALAWHITNFIGPLLSEQAKARKGGVSVRVSMCIGEDGGIFDIDLHIGKGSCNSDVCLDYKGPREELERRRSKLESRRWF